MVLPQFRTGSLAQTPQPSVNEQVTLPLDVADSIYSANTSKFLGSKDSIYSSLRTSNYEVLFLFTIILTQSSSAGLRLNR